MAWVRHWVCLLPVLEAYDILLLLLPLLLITLGVEKVEYHRLHCRLLVLGLPELIKTSGVWLSMVCLLKYDDRLSRVLTDVLDDSMFVVIVWQAFLHLVWRYISPAYASHIAPIVATLQEISLFWRGGVRAYELSQRDLREYLSAHRILKHILEPVSFAVLSHWRLIIHISHWLVDILVCWTGDSSLPFVYHVHLLINLLVLDIIPYLALCMEWTSFLSNWQCVTLVICIWS